MCFDFYNRNSCRSCAGRHGVKYQQKGDDWRIELFVCDVRVSFRFDGLAVVNDAMNLPRLTPGTVDVIFDTYKTDLRCDIVMFKAEIKRWASLTTFS
jgi:hypothetical protein